jgi:hypothetical protein
MKLKAHLLLVLMGCFFANTGWAQLTVNVGYSSAMYKNKALSNIISTFNINERDTLSQQFRTPAYLHGVVMGLRYRWDDFAIEGSYTLRLNSNTAIFGTPDANPISQKLSTRYDVWSLGITGYLNSWLGIGTSVDLTHNRFKNKRSNEETSAELLNQQSQSSTVYLVFDFPSNGLLSLSIKPFLQLPWTKTDFSKLSEGLNKTNDQIESRWWTAGITFLFCNGKRG